MSRYLAADVYGRLVEADCVPTDNTFDDGGGWVARDGRPFTFPIPEEVNGIHWLDAEVLDHFAADRWFGFNFVGLKRYY